MQQEDYLMRQVSRLTQLLARVLHLRSAGQETEAASECERGLRDLFGCDPNFLVCLASQHVLEALHLTSGTGLSGPSYDVAQVAAGLLDQYASLCQSAGRGADGARFQSHADAIRVYLQAHP